VIRHLAMALAAAWILFALPLNAHAQEIRLDPRILQLRVLRAIGDLRQADTALSRTQYLHSRNLATTQDLEASVMARDKARLEVLEQWIGASASLSHVQIVRARKARTTDGRIVARIRLAAVPLADLRRAEVERALGRDLVQSARPGVIHDLFVSVKDDAGSGGTAIGIPYEHHLTELGDDEPREVEFRLLRDVDELVVSVTVGDRTEERKVWLETDHSGTISIVPRQFSQDADFGARAEYEFTLERFGDDPAPLRIAAAGLPPEISSEVVDARSGARIGQLSFAVGEHERTLRLVVTMPVDEESGVSADSALRFAIVAAESKIADRMLADERPDSLDVWRQAGAGVAELELVPRGVGRIEVRAFNLYQEVEERNAAHVRMVIRNPGSRPVKELRITGDGLPGWRVTAEPATVAELAPDADQEIRLAIEPPSGAEIGDYDVGVRAEALSGRQRLVADPVTYRIRIRARSSWVAMAGLLSAIAAAALGVLVLTRKLARR
jgi:hypothetical protein